MHLSCVLMKERPYHHGNLPAAVVAAALETVTANGPYSISLRDLARRVGVTHGAASHHFGGKTGLFTAIATEGFSYLAEALEEAWSQTGDFAEVGVAYVAFAVEHAAHFQVMFRPDLYERERPELVAAALRARRALDGPASTVADAADGDVERAAVAAWAFVHGIAMLVNDGNLPPQLSSDPVSLTRSLTPLLFQGSSAVKDRGRRRDPSS